MRSMSALAGVFALALPTFAQPANDLCDDAAFISMPAGGQYTSSGSTSGSTADLSDSGCADADGRDVWFRFVAPRSGGYTFDLSGSTFDTTISVWLGDCFLFSPGTALACNDDRDLADLTSFLQNVPLDAGSLIRVRIAGVGNAVGAYVLRITTPSGASVQGACCNGSTCTVQAAGTCEGSFVGINTLCTPALCSPQVSGTCCIGALCIPNPSQSACVSPEPTIGAVFVASVATCNPAGNTQSPCCYADFNKSGAISPQDIFDFLNAWFSSSPYARVAGDGISPPVVQDLFEFLNAWFIGGC